MQGSLAYKNFLKIVEIDQRVCSCGASLYQKVEISNFLGPRSHLRVPIGVEFCTAKQTHVSLSCAKFHMNRCNES